MIRAYSILFMELEGHLHLASVCLDNNRGRLHFIALASNGALFWFNLLQRIGTKFPLFSYVI